MICQHDNHEDRYFVSVLHLMEKNIFLALPMRWIFCEAWISIQLRVAAGTVAGGADQTARTQPVRKAVADFIETKNGGASTIRWIAWG